MTRLDRLERVEALERQLDELKNFMLTAQQRVADVLNAAKSGPPVSPVISGFSSQLSAENGHSGPTADRGENAGDSPPPHGGALGNVGNS